MTTDARVVTFSSQDDTMFRAWGSGISGAWKAAGLVQTADTGQIDWGLASRGTESAGFEFIIGYEMYRLNDALQATAPVFIKIEYGVMVAGPTNGGYPPGHPVLYATVGTATDGAGAFTGTLITSRVKFIGTNGSTANAATVANAGIASGGSQIYASGDGSYVALSVGAQSTAQPTINWVYANQPMSFPAFLIVERSRDSGGVATGDGVVMMTSFWRPEGSYGSTHATTPSPTSQFLSFTGATVGAQGILWPVDWPSNAWGTGVFGPDIYTYPLRMVTPKPMYGMSVLGTYKSDFSLGSLVSLTNLGALHTYRSLAGIGGTSNNDNARSYTNPTIASGAILMRWE